MGVATQAWDLLDEYFASPVANRGARAALASETLARVVDATAPVVLRAARAVRDGSVPVSTDDRYRTVATGSPFVHAIAFRSGDDGRWVAVAVSTTVPMSESPTVRASVAAHRERVEPELRARGLSGAGLTRALTESAVGHELALERTYAREGYPRDLDPSAASADGMFACAADTLEGVVESVRAAEAGDWDRASFEAWTSGSRPDADGPLHRVSSPNVGDPCLWVEALDGLRPLLGSLGLLAGVETASREVAARRYDASRWDGTPEAILARVAALLALADGGLPGPDVAGFLGDFGGMALARDLQDLLPRLDVVVSALRDDGHVSESGQFGLKGGGVHVEATEEGDLLVLQDVRGDFLVDCVRGGGGAFERFRVARFGSLGLGQAEAARRLSGDDVGFPGYLGRYEAGGGAVGCAVPPPFRTRAVRDAGLVESLLHEASCALGEYAAAPAPP